MSIIVSPIELPLLSCLVWPIVMHGIVFLTFNTKIYILVDHAWPFKCIRSAHACYSHVISSPFLSLYVPDGDAYGMFLQGNMCCTLLMCKIHWVYMYLCAYENFFLSRIVNPFHQSTFLWILSFVLVNSMSETWRFLIYTFPSTVSYIYFHTEDACIYIK